jgi:hypothetical protein
MKEIPKVGDLLIVWDDSDFKHQEESFIGFTKNGNVVTEDEHKNVSQWAHYRIPQKMVKYNVWRKKDGGFDVAPDNLSLSSYCKLVHSFELPE